MPLLLEDSFHYTLAHREFYEPLDRYRPTEDDYLRIARRHLPDSWQILRSGIWFNCIPPEVNVPAQGWKIHVSALTGNSASVLATVCRLLGDRGVLFKFALDAFVFRLVNGKNWSRGGAGKFITAYPVSVAQCQELLDALRDALVGYSGPYILSDRRYRDSRTVHYRYGGIAPTKRLGVSGEHHPVIHGSDGDTVDDDRVPFFRLPLGVQDPFQPQLDDPAQDQGPAATLKGGRYRIDGAISFSNSGGVYLGADASTGRKVIIKEARPCTSQNQAGTDAVWLLKKEYRLLRLLQDLRVAPEPIDFFQEWEHYYLVEEFIEGQILRGYNAKWALALNTRPTQADAKEYLRRYRRLYTRIAEVVAALHARNVVFSDLSHYNVIVVDDGDDIKLIDFEGAYEQGVEAPTLLYTPGFAPKEVYQDGSSERKDDYYGLGGLMLAGVWPINSILALDPHACDPFLRSAVRDLSFPEEIAEVIKGLLVPEREARRIGVSEVISVLARDRTVRAPHISSLELDETDLPSLLEQTLSYIAAVADVSRDDRLYPGPPAVFQTNPLSFAYGACGIAHMFHRIHGEVDAAVLSWLARHPVDAALVPPGLLVGSAGVAWSLLEIGEVELAERALNASNDHPLRFASPDLFDGAAGWGMAQLRFYLARHEQCYLDRAHSAGLALLESGQVAEDGVWWRKDGAEYSGMGHGGAGIALFLLYLARATGDERFLKTGRAAVERVIARAIATPTGGLTWRAQEGHPTITPYWRWGSAGIGIAILRYNAALPDEPYAAVLSRILLDCDRKFSIFSGQHLGLAGIGEFLLDLAQWGHEPEEALAAARKVLSGALLFRIQRPEGVAFPGESRTRLCCDYATGSAGVASFIHRYLSGGPPVFMLDSLLGADRATSANGMATFGDRPALERA